MSLFDQPTRWFTIPAHRPFLEDLARAPCTLTLAATDPEALADAMVLTPTRRGARSLTEAFLKAGGGRALLLPQILALGDLDEGEPPFEPGDLALDLPPAITPGQRRFELARLVLPTTHPCSSASLTPSPPWSWARPWAPSWTPCRSRRSTPTGKLDGLVDEDMARPLETLRRRAGA